ncbi:hypothetical protein DRW07_04805 [Alteromonas sediminis]|uniref:Lipoprotein n=1 Tax=Alteromonas sediminis TaxID=2259342 RepID=A0A3N5Y3R3_9ALTE|nr:Sbal_3080 family lipoprotein [Alteromonas sediminis]RPJ68717.1 hypothetical protein DRW07_04805 [Alteromonas sediminis]
MQKQLIQLLIPAALFGLAGCAAKQTISAFQKAPPKKICVARHDAVRQNFHDALTNAFNTHNSETKTIRANYVEKHQAWHPTIIDSHLDDCDAFAFYVANWTWDITMYMHFANIWITDTSMSEKIAQATYVTGGGPDKWINAKEKVDELVYEMYKPVSGLAPVNYVNSTEVISTQPTTESVTTKNGTTPE